MISASGCRLKMSNSRINSVYKLNVALNKKHASSKCQYLQMSTCVIVCILQFNNLPAYRYCLLLADDLACREITSNEDLKTLPSG